MLKKSTKLRKNTVPISFSLPLSYIEWVKERATAQNRTASAIIVTLLTAAMKK